MASERGPRATKRANWRPLATAPESRQQYIWALNVNRLQPAGATAQAPMHPFGLHCRVYLYTCRHTHSHIDTHAYTCCTPIWPHNARHGARTGTPWDRLRCVLVCVCCTLISFLQASQPKAFPSMIWPHGQDALQIARDSRSGTVSGISYSDSINLGKEDLIGAGCI